MVDIDLSEVDRLAKTIGAFPEQADKVAAVAGETIGALVESRAKAQAPKGRPWLSVGGIVTRSWAAKGASHTDVLTIEDEDGVNVGFEQEYGNSTMPPQPFLTQQLAWAGPAYLQVIEAGLASL